VVKSVRPVVESPFWRNCRVTKSFHLHLDLVRKPGLKLLTFLFCFWACHTF